MDEPDGQRFRRRSGLIILFVLFWAFLCLGGVFYYSIVKRQHYRALARETAWRQGRLPALRGSIYASDGTLLAYSKLEFFLFWKPGPVKIALEDLFGRSLQNGGKISEKELSLLKPVYQKYPSKVWVETRERRFHAVDLNRIEEKYDSVLKGQDGIFVVMHDRYGRRVSGSMKVIREQIPGRSVTLAPGEEKNEK